jgi:hypothetical protein
MFSPNLPKGAQTGKASFLPDSYLCYTKTQHMAKVIPLTTIPDELSLPTHAAWQLAYAILWNHDRLPMQEERYAKESIRRQLAHGKLTRRSFIEVCERLLLAGKCLTVSPDTWIDQPSIWFHPEFTGGFADTQAMQQKVVLKRKAVPRYQWGLYVFATYYWRYLQSPSDLLLHQCYQRLHRLREYGLLQVWSNVILLIHMNKIPA